MSTSLVLLAAAAVLQVSGDFDHDGVADRAFVREAGETHELVVERGAGGISVVKAVDPLYFYLGLLEAGTYETACAKGFGPADAPCPERSVTLAGPTLEFGMEEASQAVAIWDGQGFRIVWLSD